MSLTQTQIDLVKQSFELVAPIADVAAELFYTRLFEVEPSVRQMFRGDMKEQGRRLMQMIAVAVHALDHLDTIVPAVQALGARHAGYGVKPEHYGIVGDTLLWTLERGLGDAFTPEVKDAWAAVYTLLAQTALSGAEVPQAA